MRKSAIFALLFLFGCEGQEPNFRDSPNIEGEDPVTYGCDRIDNNGSAAEAQPVFQLGLVNDGSAVNHGIEVEDECSGKQVKTPKQFAGHFQKFNIGGKECASDGYKMLVELAMFKQVQTGLVLIEANEDTDYYLCELE